MASQTRTPTSLRPSPLGVTHPRLANTKSTSLGLTSESSEEYSYDDSSTGGYRGRSYWKWRTGPFQPDSESSGEEASPSNRVGVSQGPSTEGSVQEPNWASIYPHSHARPKTVLEALAAWELPKMREVAENDCPGPDPHEYSGGDSSDGYSETQRVTHDSPLLEAIMCHDPILRSEGITITVDNWFLKARIGLLAGMMKRKPKPGSLHKVLQSIERANRILRQEVSTSEATTTGILRATLYSVINDVLAEPRLFKKKHRQLVGRLVYGDPATTTASGGDVTGWYTQEPLSGNGLNLHQAQSRVIVEHKLERSLRDFFWAKMVPMEYNFWGEWMPSREPIHIKLAPKGGLKWSWFDGKDDAQVRRQICQVLTQLFCNKTSDCVLFNTRHLRVFSRTQRKSVIHMSELCERTSPRQNVKPDTGEVEQWLNATPALSLLAVLATSVDVPSTDLPHTKFKRSRKRKRAATDQDAPIRGWAKAPEDSIPFLREACVDSGIIAIAETASQASKDAAPLMPTPKRPLLFQGAGTGPRTRSANKTAKSSSNGPAPKTELAIYDIHTESQRPYTIKLNELWKPLLSPGSSACLHLVSKGATCKPEPDTLNVEISNIISSGRLYATYEGLWRNAEGAGKDTKVVVKFACPDRYPSEPRNRFGHTFETARDAVTREASLYACELSALQGSIVPRFYGTFINDQGVLATVLERGGDPVLGHSGKIASFSKVVKERLRQVYKELHQAGVIHRDVCMRHCLKAPGRQANRKHNYWLIDFEGAIVPPYHSLKKYADAEMTRLEALFDNHAADGLRGWSDPVVQ